MEMASSRAEEIFDKGILGGFGRRELLEMEGVEFGRNKGEVRRSKGFLLGSHFDKILIWTVI